MPKYNKLYAGALQYVRRGTMSAGRIGANRYGGLGKMAYKVGGMGGPSKYMKMLSMETRGRYQRGRGIRRMAMGGGAAMMAAGRRRRASPYSSSGGTTGAGMY